MTEVERTSGPWRIKAGTDSGVIESQDGVSVAATYTPRGVRQVRQANARFIAAGPDMEKALEAWLEWDGEIGEGPSPPMLARAALAKARGETPNA